MDMGGEASLQKGSERDLRADKAVSHKTTGYNW